MPELKLIIEPLAVILSSSELIHASCGSVYTLISSPCAVRFSITEKNASANINLVILSFLNGANDFTIFVSYNKVKTTLIMIRAFCSFVINLLLLVTFTGCKSDTLKADISEIDLEVEVQRFDKDLFTLDLDTIDRSVSMFYDRY